MPEQRMCVVLLFCAQANLQKMRNGRWRDSLMAGVHCAPRCVIGTRSLAVAMAVYTTLQMHHQRRTCRSHARAGIEAQLGACDMYQYSGHCRCTVKDAASTPKVAGLQLLADGKLPLPELDFAEQLKGLGLPWRAQKTSRLKRCCIARAPEVAWPWWHCAHLINQVA